MRPDVFIVSAEPSGDALAAALRESLKTHSFQTTTEFIGGRAMETGEPSPVNMDGLAILGFAEGVRSLPLVRRKVREVSNHILSRDPRSVVLIDSWGFMVRVAKQLKRRGYGGHIVKYVSPQVWATRSGRARVLARHVDYLLSTQPMDAPCYDGTGLPLIYVGNPVLDQDYRAGDAAAFCARHDLDPNRPTLGVFPGSRPSEFDRLLGPIRDNVLALGDAVPGLQTVWVLSSSADESVESVARHAEASAVCDQTELIDALAAIDVAHAASGTITTQLACAGVPTVVVYKLSPLTFFFASRLFKPDYISLVNIAADAPLMPEFMQDDVGGEGLRAALRGNLVDADARRDAGDALLRQTHAMGAGQQNASDRAAEALLAILRGEAP